jgi:hypothetical protein
LERQKNQKVHQSIPGNVSDCGIPAVLRGIFFLLAAEFGDWRASALPLIILAMVAVIMDFLLFCRPRACPWNKIRRSPEEASSGRQAWFHTTPGEITLGK